MTDCAEDNNVGCLMKCLVCGKVSHDSAACCALSPYELALNGYAGYEHLSLQYFLNLPKCRPPLVAQNSLFAARLSTKREPNGEKGTYVDLAGDYETLCRSIFYTHKLTLDDQYRISIMMLMRGGRK